jgi:2-polyprenyl-6-methoxyphenol hydroxylase-like FAD-dependent oxidoreductase
MNHNPNSLHVLIIGGGIGGLTLALYLKKAGIISAVYEAFPHKGGIGGAFNIAPNGMKVLAGLGLADKIIAGGVPVKEHCFRNDKGRVIARMGNGSIKKYGQPGVSLTRSLLHEILTAEVHAQGIPIHYEKKLEHINQDIVGVTAYFEDGHFATGDILIGADGIRSRTRSLTFPGGPQPEYIGLVGVGGFVPLSALPSLTQRDKESMNYTFGAKGFFGYGVGNKDYAMWWSNLPREKELTQQELKDLSLDSVKEEMLSIYTGYHEPVETLIRNTERPLKINLADIQSLPCWSRDRVLLIGDAAHAVSPNAGQGASMALEDAMYLAKLLRDTDGKYDKAFAQFEHDRKPRVEKIVAEGRKRGADKKIVGPLRARIREIMMSVFINLFGEKGFDWLYRYKIDWN